MILNVERHVPRGCPTVFGVSTLPIISQRCVPRREMQSSIGALGLPSKFELNRVISKKGKVVAPHGSRQDLVRCLHCIEILSVIKILNVRLRHTSRQPVQQYSV
jgi:hypothetical protein